MMTTLNLLISESAGLPLGSGLPLEGVIVRLYSLDGVTLHGEATSDSSGAASFMVPEGSYWARFYKVGYLFDSRIRVDTLADPSIPYLVAGVDPIGTPQALQEHLCAVYGQIRLGNSLPAEGIRISFLPDQADEVISGTSLTIEEPLTTITTKTGFTATLIQGRFYDCHIAGMQKSFRIATPLHRGVSFLELLHPYLAVLRFSATELSLSLSENSDGVEIQVSEATLSSYVTLPLTWPDGSQWQVPMFVRAVLASDVVSTSWRFDADIAYLKITPKSVGATAISFVRSESGVETRRSPEPVRDMPIISVTVTA